MRLAITGLIAVAVIGLHTKNVNAQDSGQEAAPQTNPLALPREPSYYCTQYGIADAWGDDDAGVHCFGDAGGGLCTDGGSFWSEANPCSSSHP